MHFVSRRLALPCIPVLALVFAAAGHAASLSIDVDSNFSPVDGPGPGDSITVTVLGTIDPGDADTGVDLYLSYDEGLVEPDLYAAEFVTVTVDPILAASDQLTSFDGGSPWTVGGSQGTCNFGECVLLLQLAGFTPLEPDQTSVVMVARFLGIGAGDPFFATQGDFFGAPNVGASVLIPEPATGGLVAFGLLAFGIARRCCGAS